MFSRVLLKLHSKFVIEFHVCVINTRRTLIMKTALQMPLIFKCRARRRREISIYLNSRGYSSAANELSESEYDALMKLLLRILSIKLFN